MWIPLSHHNLEGMTHERLTKREDCHAAYRSHKTSPIADASASIASTTSDGTCGLLRRQATSSRTVRSASCRLRDSDWASVANSFDLISSEARLLRIKSRSFISGSFLCSRRRNFCSDQLGVKIKKRPTDAVGRVFDVAARYFADRRLTTATTNTHLFLGKSRRRNFRSDFYPVHAAHNIGVPINVSSGKPIEIIGILWI